MLGFLVSLLIDFAYASHHEDICWANPDAELCGLLSSPFSVIIAPFETIAPGYGVLFLWAPVVFGLWFATRSPAIAGIFGVVLVSVVEGIHPQAVGVGLVLIAVSGGIALIQVFQRIKQTV